MTALRLTLRLRRDQQCVLDCRAQADQCFTVVHGYGCVSASGQRQASIRAARYGSIPAGTYYFASPLDPVVADELMIEGDGHRTKLIYNGAATSGDLLTFGSLGTPTSKLSLSGFVVNSTTTKTAGWGVICQNIVRVDFDVLVGDGNFTLYHGGLFNKCAYVALCGSEFHAQATHCRMAEVIEGHCEQAFIGGKLVAGQGSGIGLYISDCGGIYGEDLRQQYNEFGCLIDTSATGAGNTQIFLRTAVFDGNKSHGVYVDDSVSNAVGKYLEIGWVASTAAGTAVSIVNWRNGDICLPEPAFKNNAGNGMTIADATINLAIGAAASIANNGGYGIGATVAVTIRCYGVPRNNTSGAFQSNITVLNTTWGTMRTRANPLTSWLIDGTATETTVTIANGANAILPGGSGIVTVANDGNGDGVAVICSGGGVLPLSDGGSTGGGYVNNTTSPAGTKWSVANDGAGAYRIYNNVGSSVNFKVIALVRMRTSI